MCRIGVDYMRTTNETIMRIATSPNKSMTTTEAKKILRNCGILNGKNQVNSAYQNMISKSSEASNGRI